MSDVTKVRVFRPVMTRPGRTVPAGLHVVGEGVSDDEARVIVARPRWGVLAVGELAPLPEEGAEEGAAGDEPDLSATNEALAQFLVGLDEEGRAAFWNRFEVDALNALLSERFDVKPSGRAHGKAVNMLESRLSV